jgi:YVTN family beta-propeller protein
MKNITAPSRAYAMFLALALILPIFYLQQSSGTIVTAQEVTPQGELREVAIDDGVAECILGAPETIRGKPGFGWVNKLTPTTYPATLRSVTIGFNRGGPLGREVLPDSLFRIVVYADPEMDGPGGGQVPDATFIGRVRGSDQIMTFNLVTPLTIQSGSLIVGVLDEFGIADFPALLDVPGKSTPPGSDSFITSNAGESWQKISDIPLQGESPCNKPGSFLIRATVETGAVEPLTVTTIKDPEAVEPWGVAAGLQETFVTNYVSDNVTIINRLTNGFQNLAVGDGPGNTPNGPFGVVTGNVFTSPTTTATRAFVTLFGSNTIPSKEFPTDYSTVGPGRVAVLARAANGSYSQTLEITVGKGPRFPALINTSNPNRSKLYVPCGGDNRVDVIDAGTGNKITEIPVGADPSSCTASLNNAKVYVTNFGDGSISVIDTKTDKKIKDIPAPTLSPFVDTTLPALTASNPWQGAISETSGNLFVTYWGTTNTDSTNGAIVEFDICSDTFVRAIIDDTTRGTPAGSAGATGIVAPSGPLTRDPATGATLGAGGGGGGPFGIASCGEGTIPLVFTNDAIGKAAILDPRIGQVVTSPSIGGDSCAKPRGVDCAVDPRPIPPTPGLAANRVAYVACGQPDNAVMIFNMPSLSENIVGMPTIESVSVGSNIKIRGKGLVLGTRLEVISPDSSACLTFDQEPKFKKKITLLLQKGRLSDGSKPGSLNNIIIRLVMPDGTISLVRSTRL